MCQRTCPVHFRKIDDCTQRFRSSRSIAAASCTKSDSKRTLISNIFIADLKARNLRDFSVDTQNSARLRAAVPDGVLFVSESGGKHGRILRI